MFERIKRYYELGLWGEKQVQDAVKKGVITEEEAQKIMKGEEI